MDAKRKATIIKTLTSGTGLPADKRFDSNYSPEGRLWFVTAIVDAVLAGSPTPADDKVEGLALAIIADANVSVQADRNIEPNVQLDAALKKRERKDLARRVEALYGVMAQKPELTKTPTDATKPLVKLRRLVARRRYRGVVRMVYQVNPNALGYMRYPGDCPADTRWRVNVDAQPLWKKTGAGDVPLAVIDKIGANDVEPADAVAKVWAKPFPKGDECKGNLLDCANAAACVLMDTLVEAADPKKLFKAIKNRGPKHFVITNPSLGSEEHYLFEKENEPHRVFSKEMVREADFQVGDHVVVTNHPLYVSLMPFGLWQAEHSLVTNLGNRKPDDGKGIRFGGHGLDDPFTIPGIYDHLIKELQTQLHRTFRIADLFLRFMRADAADPSPLTLGSNIVKKANLTVRDPRTMQHIAFDGYTIFFDVTYDDFKKPPKGGKAAQQLEGEGANPLVVFDIKQTSEIAIARPTVANKLLDQMAKMNAATQSIMVFIKRVPGSPPAGQNYYARAAWQVPFVDVATDPVKFHPLFGGPGGAFVQLQRKDMPTGNGRYARNGHTEPGAHITRPTVDVAKPYTDFLASIGAI